MKFGDLKTYFEQIKDKVADDTEIIILTTVDDSLKLKSFVDDVKVFADTDSEGKWLNPHIAVTGSVNLMGTVETLNLIDNIKRDTINDIVARAEKKEVKPAEETCDTCTLEEGK